MPDVDIKMEYNGVTFNDFSDKTSIFLLRNIPEGLIQADIADNAVSKYGQHGAIHGPNYYGRRQIFMEGDIIGEDQATRKILEEQLRAAFALPRAVSNASDGFLTLTITDEDGSVKTVRAKPATPLSLAKETAEAWTREFSITMELEKPYLESAQKNTTALEEKPDTNLIFIFDPPTNDWNYFSTEGTAPTTWDEMATGGSSETTWQDLETGTNSATNTIEVTEDGIQLIYYPEETYTLTNEGNFSAAPLIIFSGVAENPEIINTTTGKSMKLETTISYGETIEIDVENATIRKILIDGTEEDISATLTIDSEWILLEVGDNEITIQDITPDERNLQADIYWKDAYI